jgi:hypothetical protein
MGHWECVTFLALPCRCGAGRFEAWYSSENYPPFRTDHERGGHIDCPACNAVYEIKVCSRSDVRLYRRDEVETACAVSDIRDQQAEAFYKSSPVMQNIHRLLLELLGGEKTKAGKIPAAARVQSGA